MASGFDNLIDALKQSGMDVDNIGGTGRDGEGEASDAAGAGEGASTGEGAGSGGSSRSRGDMPFGGGTGFPFTAFGGGRRRGAGGGGGDEPPNIEFASQLGDRMASWSKRTIVIAVIVALIIVAIAYWWFHPPISINSIDTWIFVTICILLPAFVFCRGRSRRYETGDSKLDPNPGKSKSFKFLSFIPVVILALGTGGNAFSFTGATLSTGSLGSFPVTCVIMSIGMSLGGATGYALNPARDFGPRVAHAMLPIAGKRDSAWWYGWVPVAGPMAGAALAAVLFLLVF